MKDPRFRTALLRGKVRPQMRIPPILAVQRWSQQIIVQCDYNVIIWDSCIILKCIINHEDKCAHRRFRSKVTQNGIEDKLEQINYEIFPNLIVEFRCRLLGGI